MIKAHLIPFDNLCCRIIIFGYSATTPVNTGDDSKKALLTTPIYRKMAGLKSLKDR
jgi:hypothetical protein